jgi:hypothetical protein
MINVFTPSSFATPPLPLSLSLPFSNLHQSYTDKNKKNVENYFNLQNSITDFGIRISSIKYIYDVILKKSDANSFFLI